MSAAYPGAGIPDRRDDRRDVVADVRVAASIAVALSIIGVLLGLVWSAWSPDRPPARVTAGGRLQFESEAWVAADGRYLLIVVVAGLLAALLAWTRTTNRGPAILLGLALGGLAGAALTWLTGWLAGGGSDSTQTQGYIPVTRLTLHTTGLVFLEAGVAVLVYGLLVAFAARDDLGRDDPVRDRLLAAAPATAAPYPPPPPGPAVDAAPAHDPPPGAGRSW